MWEDESEAVAPIIWLYQTVDAQKEEVFFPDLLITLRIYAMPAYAFYDTRRYCAQFRFRAIHVSVRINAMFSHKRYSKENATRRIYICIYVTKNDTF